MAVAIRKDIDAMLGAFYGQSNLSFCAFKVLWVQQQMSYLHFAAHANMDRDPFYQLVYDMVLRLLHAPPMPGSNPAGGTSSLSPSASSMPELEVPSAGHAIVWNMGVVYFLYTFCCTQVKESKSIVHVSPEIFASLRMAVEQMSWLGKIGEDAVKVFGIMLEKNLFVFGLTTGPTTQWGSHRYEDNAVGMRLSLLSAIHVHQQLVAQVNINANTSFIAEIKKKYEASFDDDVEQELIAHQPAEDGSDSESEEAEEKEEEPAQGYATLQAREEEEPVQEPPKKKVRAKKKVAKNKTLSAKNSVDAVLRLLPAHQRTASSSSVTVASASTVGPDQSANPAQHAEVPGPQQQQEEEESSESSSSESEDEEEGNQYMSQRQKEAERMKAHIQRLNEQGD